MKIATFNINNVNKRLANLLAWLREAKPDVVGLQELKAADAEFPAAAIEQAGYGAVWQRPEILERRRHPGARRRADRHPRRAAGRSGRHPGALHRGRRQRRHRHLALCAQRQSAAGAEVRLQARLACGGSTPMRANCSTPAFRSCWRATTTWCRPTSISIRPSPTRENALLQPESRTLFRQLLEQGWVDAIRKLHPDAPMFTFWDYMRNRWPRDAGLRLDHLLLSKSAARRLVDAGVDRDVRGETGASDHAPAWVVLRDAAASRTSAPRKSSRQEGRRWPQDQGGRAQDHRAQGRQAGAGAPAVAGDRRRFVRASRLSRAAEDHHAARRPAGRRDPRLCQHAAALLRGRAARAPCWSAWDTLDVPTYRHKAFAAYQSGREFDRALLEQLDALPEFVDGLRLRQRQGGGLRGRRLSRLGGRRRGAPQGHACWSRAATATPSSLRPSATTILYPVRAGEIARIGPAEVRARYGVEPRQVPDFIALRGDPSDRLPGVPGVGPQGAAGVLRTYGSLEAALEAGRFAALAERLRMFRSLATMDRKAPLPRLRDQRPTWTKAAALARDWRPRQACRASRQARGR